MVMRGIGKGFFFNRGVFASNVYVDVSGWRGFGIWQNIGTHCAGTLDWFIPIRRVVF